MSCLFADICRCMIMHEALPNSQHYCNLFAPWHRCFDRLCTCLFIMSIASIAKAQVELPPSGLSLAVSLQLPVVSHRSKWPLRLTPTAFWTLVRKTRAPRCEQKAMSLRRWSLLLLHSCQWQRNVIRTCKNMWKKRCSSLFHAAAQLSYHLWSLLVPFPSTLPVDHQWPSWGTGKSEKITITNDKGRLTEEQIQKMIREAEEFADEDKKVKERVDAKYLGKRTEKNGWKWGLWWDMVTHMGFWRNGVYEPSRYPDDYL